MHEGWIHAQKPTVVILVLFLIVASMCEYVSAPFFFCNLHLKEGILLTKENKGVMQVTVKSMKQWFLVILNGKLQKFILMIQSTTEKKITYQHVNIQSRLKSKHGEYCKE